MKDLQSLFEHPSVQGFSKLTLTSNQPITLWRNGEQKSLGGSLGNQKLHSLLKASLSAEVMSGFQWGKELSSEIQGPSGACQVQITLRPEKIIQVEITQAEVADPTESIPPVSDTTPEPTAAEPPEEAIDSDALSEEIDRLTDVEGTALIYAPAGETSAVTEAVKELGYPIRQTSSTHATLEVLKYHEYPFFFLILDDAFRTDPVYTYLATALMEARRSQFSVLVAPDLESGDTILAFSLSMNLVVNLAELARLPATVEKANAQWKRFVAPLYEFLKEAGRL